jgi:ribosome biogenesis GTPase
MTQPRQGTVVESYGRRLLVTPAGAEAPLPCKLKGRRLSVVAGDEVLIEQPPGADEWVVTESLPRRNVLARSDSRGREEPIAANLDQLCVVVAPRPPCDPFIVDRYLAGASFAGIHALLIVNKADLETDVTELAFLDSYSELHLRVLRVSARTGSGLDDLIGALSGRRSMLAGQSGVGKSSLLNALAGEQMRATGSLSDASGEGRHTTVSSALIRLPWGEIADSPGVRDYAPPVVTAREVQSGYPEIFALSPGCRFLDCLHRQEPQCAVRQAVESGGLHPRRYESYKRLLTLNRELEERRGWRG